MKKLFFLTLLLPSALLAQTHLDSALDILANPNPALELCEEDKEKFQKCAIDLCGPSGKNKSLQTPEPTPESKLISLAPAAVAEIAKVTQQVIKKNELLIAAIKKLIKQKKIIDTDEWDSDSWNEQANEIFGSHYKVTIDLKQPIPQRLSIKPLPSAAALGKPFEKWVQTLKTLAAQDPLTLSQMNGLNFEGLLTNQEINILVKKKAIELQRITKDKNYLEILQGSLKDIDSKDAETNFKAINAFKIAEASLVPKTVMCDKDCKKFLKNYYFTTAKAKLSSFEKANRDPLQIQAGRAECASKFMVGEDVVNKSANFRKKVPALLDKFIAGAMNGSSAHSKDAFKKYFNEKIKLHLIESRSDTMAALDKMKEKIASDALIDEDEKAWQVLEDIVYNNKVDLLGRSPACSNWEEIFIDQFKGPEDKLTLSRFTCTYDEPGEGIFLHELGHVLSHALLTNKLSVESLKGHQKLRNCVSKAHPIDLPFHTGHPGDNLFTEEDTADVAAYRSISTAGLFSCLMLENSPDGITYLNLSLSNYLDSHSTGFLRVIKEKLYRDKANFPPSCQDVITTYGGNLGFELCQ